MKFNHQLLASFVVAGFGYLSYYGMIWKGNFSFKEFIETSFGFPMPDFAGSVFVHGMDGWIAIVAVMKLGPRLGGYKSNGDIIAQLPSSISIPF